MEEWMFVGAVMRCHHVISQSSVIGHQVGGLSSHLSPSSCFGVRVFVRLYVCTEVSSIQQVEFLSWG